MRNRYRVTRGRRRGRSYSSRRRVRRTYRKQRIPGSAIKVGFRL